MALAGISTLGVTFGFGVETVAGTKPTAFTKLTRINSIGGISVESETIDASALEDLVTRTIAGRGDTGGTFSVVVNATPNTQAEWQDLITKFQAAKTESKRVWFETVIPGFQKSFFVVAQPPQAIPQPEIGQNELLTMEFGLAIEEYKGMDATVALTANPLSGDEEE